MHLDREFQRKILRAAADNYPGSISEDVYSDLTNNKESGFVAANLYYLYEHGLIHDCFRKAIGMPLSASKNIRCTNTGVDFVADDGGLSAILGTVTVKLHEDTLRGLIELRISQSGLPQEEKGEMISMLKKLPADSIKHLTMKLLEKGMELAPTAAVGLISSFLK